MKTSHPSNSSSSNYPNWSAIRNPDGSAFIVQWSAIELEASMNKLEQQIKNAYGSNNGCRELSSENKQSSKELVIYLHQLLKAGIPRQLEIKDTNLINDLNLTEVEKKYGYRLLRNAIIANRVNAPEGSLIESHARILDKIKNPELQVKVYELAMKLAGNAKLKPKDLMKAKSLVLASTSNQVDVNLKVKVKSLSHLQRKMFISVCEDRLLNAAFTEFFTKFNNVEKEIILQDVKNSISHLLNKTCQ